MPHSHSSVVSTTSLQLSLRLLFILLEIHLQNHPGFPLGIRRGSNFPKSMPALFILDNGHPEGVKKHLVVLLRIP